MRIKIHILFWVKYKLMLFVVGSPIDSIALFGQGINIHTFHELIRAERHQRCMSPWGDLHDYFHFCTISGLGFPHVAILDWFRALRTLPDYDLWYDKRGWTVTDIASANLSDARSQTNVSAYLVFLLLLHGFHLFCLTTQIGYHNFVAHCGWFEKLLLLPPAEPGADC